MLDTGTVLIGPGQQTPRIERVGLDRLLKIEVDTGDSGAGGDLDVDELRLVETAELFGHGLHQRATGAGLIGLELERTKRQLHRLAGEDRDHGRSALKASRADVRPRICDIREDLDLHVLNATRPLVGGR